MVRFSSYGSLHIRSWFSAFLDRTLRNFLPLLVHLPRLNSPKPTCRIIALKQCTIFHACDGSGGSSKRLEDCFKKQTDSSSVCFKRKWCYFWHIVTRKSTDASEKPTLLSNNREERSSHERMVWHFHQAEWICSQAVQWKENDTSGMFVAI